MITTAESVDTYLYALVDTLHQPLVMLDETLRATAANRAFYEMFLISAQETEGHHFCELKGGAWNVPEIQKLLKDTSEDPGTGMHQIRLVSIDGKVLNINARKMPFENGRGSRIVVAIEDRTVRPADSHEVELREERELFLAIFNGIPVMITLYDPQIQRVQLNHAFEKITGWTEEDAGVHNIMELVYPDPTYRQEVTEYMQSLSSGFREIVMAGKNGERIQSSWANIRLPDGRQVGIGIDIRERKRSEHALIDALTAADRDRKQLDAIINAVSDGIMVFDKNGAVALLNQAEARINEFSSVEEMKRSLDFFAQVYELRTLDQEVVPLDQWPTSRVMRGEVFGGWELLGRRTDTGREWTFEFNGNPVYDDAGQQILSVVVTRDITDRKRAEKTRLENERRYAALFNNKTFGVAHCKIVVDDRGKPIDYIVLEINDAYTSILGVEKKDIEGKRVTEVFPGIENFYFDFIGNYGKVALEGTDLQFEVNFDYANKWLYVYAYSPIHMEFVAIFTDITDRKRVEEELNRRAEELASANQDLEAFSYSVSHDLRTPLTTVGGFSTILTEDYGHLLDNEGKDYLRRIGDSVKKMQQLISDMLSLSRIGRQEMNREDVDLSSLITEYLHEIHSSQPYRKAIFHVESGIHASADPRLIHVALENLLRNAWKFASRQETTVIEFGTTRSEGRTIYFIRDNGVGFDMKFAQSIFEPFKRSHSDGEFKGTGVGLSIVQRVISRHGGRVWAEGYIDRGACFFFTLER